MKDFLTILIFAGFFLIFLAFRNFWFKYEDFFIIRRNVIKTLRCIITNREMPERFSCLIDTLKSDLLILMESRFYNKTDKKEIQICYLEIEKIQENLENADYDVIIQTVYKKEYFNNLKKFEKIGKTKILILETLWCLWIFAITLIFLVLISMLIYFFFSLLFSFLIDL